MTAPFEKPDRVVRFGGTADAPTTGEFTEPPGGKKDLGWALDDEPAASFWNWLTYKSYEWFRWIDERAFDLASGVGLRIKAPVVDTSADDGGDLELHGADSGADADKDGGDVLVAGGDATGAGSSKTIISAAVKGGVGVAARVSETFLTADGEQGRLFAVRPLSVIPVTTGLSQAILGSGATAGIHGVTAAGTTISPAKSALSVAPQTADPSVAPETGDIFVHSSADQLAHYSDNLGRFQNLDSVIFASVADSSPIADTTTRTAFDQKATIPANTLRAGSVIKIRGWGEYDRTGTPLLELGLLIGGLSTSLLGGTVSASNSGWQFEGQYIVGAPGGSVRLNGYTAADLTDGAGGAHQRENGKSQFTILDTTIANDVEIEAKWGTASASNTITMTGFVVEVQ